jgi:hypothetical protein
LIERAVNVVQGFVEKKVNLMMFSEDHTEKGYTIVSSELFYC